MKFYSNPVLEHADVPLSDDGQLESLIDACERAHPHVAAGPRADRTGHECYVLSVHRPDEASQVRPQLAEIVALVESLGDRVVGYECHALRRFDPRTFVGKGVAQRVADKARAAGAEMLVVDAELSPSQARNLEDVTGLPICDREGVILNVFQRSARTPRARVQVELAHLHYLRPRIRGIGLNMDKQAASMMKARGPGETASELLARRLDARVAELRRRWAQLERSAAEQRKGRDPCSRVVLLGYTNAGKTSLMNALSGANLSVRNRPFETLDTTSRCLSRDGVEVLLSDTVGFIRRLPERLMDSFASTLAEVRQASLLLIVVDVTDPQWAYHLQVTADMLSRLAADEIPALVVFNKCDLLDPQFRSDGLPQQWSGWSTLCVSSRDPHAVSELRQEILQRARTRWDRGRLFVPYQHSSLQQRIYARCQVLAVEAKERGCLFVVAAPPHVLRELRAGCEAGR